MSLNHLSHGSNQHQMPALYLAVCNILSALISIIYMLRLFTTLYGPNGGYYLSIYHHVHYKMQTSTLATSDITIGCEYYGYPWVQTVLCGHYT